MKHYFTIFDLNTPKICTFEKGLSFFKNPASFENGLPKEIQKPRSTTLHRQKRLGDVQVENETF